MIQGMEAEKMLAIIFALSKLILWIEDCNNLIPTKFSSIQSCPRFSRSIRISVLQEHLIKEKEVTLAGNMETQE